jgi:hypothetical protein
MSALGQKQTCAPQNGMSALPPKATSIAFFGMSALGQQQTNGTSLFDNLVGHRKQRLWEIYTERHHRRTGWCRACHLMHGRGSRARVSSADSN